MRFPNPKVHLEQETISFLDLCLHGPFSGKQLLPSLVLERDSLGTRKDWSDKSKVHLEQETISLLDLCLHGPFSGKG
eukprot:1161973-Pelagomonas_calceolata.AAC.6